MATKSVVLDEISPSIKKDNVIKIMLYLRSSLLSEKLILPMSDICGNECCSFLKIVISILVEGLFILL